MSRVVFSGSKRWEGRSEAWPALVLFLLLAVAAAGGNKAYAAVTVTGASGGGAISADTAANAVAPAWTALGPITIAENANGDFAQGTNITLVLRTPAGFEFNTAVTPSMSFTANRSIASASIAVTESTNLTITLTVSNNTALDSLSIGSTTPIQVRPTAGSPLATGRRIYRPSSGGGSATVSGISTSSTGTTGSNFGNLTEVVGTPAIIRVETAANGSGTLVASQNITAGNSITSYSIARDAAGNFITNATADAWSLPIATGGVGSGDLVAAGNRKSAVFTAHLSGTASIRATFGSLATTDSGTLTIVPGSATRLFLTLPGQAFVPGAGNSGSALAQTAGAAFVIQQLTAVDNFTNIATSYSGTKTISYSGPLGSPAYITSVNFTAGQSTTPLTTTLTRAETVAITPSASGLTGVASASLVVNPGTFTKLQLLLPGESPVPGTATGKTGTPAPQTQGTAFEIMVNAVDANWNLVATNDTVRIASSDPAAVLPANAALASGIRNFNITLNTVGTPTVSASNVTHSFIPPSTSPAVTVASSSAPFTTNILSFNYANRAALLADGWSFWATNNGTGRNTEMTNGAMVDYNQAVHPGGVRIPCDAGDLYQGQNDSRNTLFRQLSQNWVRTELETSFVPSVNYQQVNLLIYQQDDEYLAIDHGHNGSENISMYRELNARAISVNSTDVEATNVLLRFDRDLNTDVITGSYSLNGTSWTTVGQWIQGFANPRLGIFIGGSPGGLPNVDVRRVAVITCNTNPPRTLVLQPQKLVFNAIAGQPCTNLQQLRVVLSRDQDAPVHWTLTNATSWLLASVVTGDTPGSCDVSVNTAGLAPGVYQATLNCGAPGTVAASANVTLIVNPASRARLSTWRDGRRGGMSVSIDDSDSSGFSDLQAAGIKGSYLMWHESAPSFYPSYYAAGMELGCHTISHCCFELLRSTLRGELEGNIAGLVSSTPVPQAQVISFAWPCGFTTISEQTVAADYFLSARGYNINQLEDPSPYNFMNLKSFNSHEHPPFPPADLKTLVDAAITEGKWFNLVLHGLENSDGAIGYSVGKDIWVAPIGTVVKYILQRDRTVISNYVENAGSIQFKCFRLPLDPSSRRSFETAITANDTLTLQINITGLPAVTGFTVNGGAKAYTVRSSGGQTNLFFNLQVTTSPQTVQLTTDSLPPLTVTADNKTRPYGQNNPTLTGSLVGMQNSDNITATYTTAATISTPVGNYVISPVFNDPDNKLGNYNVVTNLGTLTITKAAATVTLANLSQVYNGTARIATATTTPAGLTVNLTYNGSTSPPTNAGSYTVIGTINNSNYSGGATNTLTISKATAAVVLSNLDHTYNGNARSATATTTPAGLAVTLSYNGATEAPSQAGSYTVTGIVNDPNYTGAGTNTLNIAKAVLIATTENAVRSYGESNPPFTINYTGFVNGETSAVIDTTPVAETTATIASPAGSYPITLTGGSDDNYVLMLIGGTLTIDPVEAMITLSDLQQTYDGTAHAASTTTTPSSLAVTLTYDGAPDAPTHAGTYTVIGTINDPNYTGAATNTLTIAKALLSATAEHQFRAYGETNPVFTVTFSGLIGGETINDLDALPAAATSATTASPPGDYEITLTGGADNDYTFSLTNGTLTITQATAVVMLNDLIQIYDGTTKSVTVTTTPDTLSCSIQYNGNLNPPTAAGDYAVVATITDSNYTGSVTNILTIQRATATITLNNLRYRYDGMVKNASCFTYPGGLNVQLIHHPGDPIHVGSYAVQAIVEDPNYTGSASDVLTIDPSDATIALTNLNHVYDGTAKTAQATTEPAGLAVSIAYDGSLNPPTNAGVYTVIAAINDPNYAASATNLLTIGKAPLTVTAEDNVRGYGQTNPVFTISFAGFIGGDGTNNLTQPPAASTTAVRESLPGSYVISVSDGADENYAFNTVNGTLTVTNAPLPEIRSITWSEGAVIVTWSAEPGLNYRLQYRESLTDTNWNDLYPDVQATEASTSASDPVPDAPQRFYRVMLVPLP